MTYKIIPYQLRNRISRAKTSLSSSAISNTADNLAILQGKEFYIWDKQEHRALYLKTGGLCCWNHAISLPIKNGQAMPMFDYEKNLFDKLFSLNGDFKDKHLWCLKSTGLGLTEFFLRVIGWLCTRNDELKGSQICIVTGPRLELSITLMNRLKALFYSKLGIIFQNKETVLDLNGVRIEAFPSDHLDAMRGLANVSFILLDEADFFKKGQQQDARDISERYIGKSNPYIVMTSTPNAPGGLFDKIEQEKEEECIYNRLKLDYTFGLGKIYTNEEIEKAKQSPSFKREYDLQYLGLQGNTFHIKDIDRAVELGEKYNPNRVSLYSEKILGIDIGFGSSAFAIVLLQVSDNMIQVLLAEQYERPRYQDMVDRINDIIEGLNSKNVDQSVLDTCKIYVDGSAPAVVTSLKELVGETTNWEYIQDKIQYSKKNNYDVAHYMNVIPVSFAQDGKSMLLHVKELLEYERPLIAINKKFDKLITALRTCQSDDQGKVNKEQTCYDDLLDAFRLALKGINLIKKTNDQV